MHVENKQRYQARFKQVVDYIHQHLDCSMNLGDLAKVAHFSKYHFQRQFTAVMGVSPIQYIQQLRLERSAYELAFRQGDICNIAFRGHFQSQEAFSRAFKKYMGQSPLRFRKSTPWRKWHAKQQTQSAFNLRTISVNNSFNIQQVSIIDFPTTPIACLTHQGQPALVMKTVSTFIAWRKAQGNLSPKVSDTFNVLYHDPQTVPASEYRFDVACSVSSPIAENESGVVNATLAQCRCATLRFIGSNEDMAQAISFLYGQWLPQSGEDCSEHPLFVKRLAMYPEVAMHQQEFELYLPIN